MSLPHGEADAGTRRKEPSMVLLTFCKFGVEAGIGMIKEMHGQ